MNLPKTFWNKSVLPVLLLLLGLLTLAPSPLKAQTIDETLEYVTTGFFENWTAYWTVTWNIPSNLSNPSLFTFAKALGRFKLANGSYQNANDVTIKQYSSGQRSGSVPFSYSTNIPLLFLNQMPNGAQWLEWKVDWVSTASWTGGFVTDGYTETSWHIHIY